MPLAPHDTTIRERTEEDPRRPTGVDRHEQDDQDTWGTAKPLLTTRRALLASLALVLVMAAVIPPAWSVVVVPLLLTFAILPWLPWLTERALQWMERRIG